MKKIRITTKTPDQIEADFKTVFAQIVPIPPEKPLTQADRLAPYRKAVLKQRRRGLTWKQIADGMRRPPIGEMVSEKLLKRVFEPKPKAVKPAAPMAPVERLILDPLTGRPVTTVR